MNWDNTTLLWAGGAAAGVVVLILCVWFVSARRKSSVEEPEPYIPARPWDNAPPPPAPSAAPAVGAAPSTIGIVGDFADPQAWRLFGEAPIGATLAGGRHRLAAGDYALSAKSLPVKPGDRFVFVYDATLEQAPTNGKPAHFVAGCLFLNAGGDVVSWGSVEGPLTEAKKSGRVEVTAPDGAATMRLYLAGMWAAEQPAPDGVVSFSRAEIARA